VGVIDQDRVDLARRFRERDPLTTVIDRRLRLVSLHQRMKAAGLTENDLVRQRGRAPDELAAHRPENAGDGPYPA